MELSSNLVGRNGAGDWLISPSRGEIAGAHAITAETAADAAARETLLDRAMGLGRKRKSSEKLRRGRKPSEGLAFAARSGWAHRGHGQAMGCGAGFA